MTRSRSRWWFVLPITLNITGGVIAFFILRTDDPPKARNCLYLGAVLAVPWMLLVILPFI